MVAEVPALVWVLQSDPLLREGRAAAAREFGLLATAVPSPRVAVEWAAGPGTTPDVIVFDDWELDMSAVEFGAGMSEALGDLTPPIVYIVSGEGDPEPVPSPPFRPEVDICLRRPVPEREVLRAVLMLVRRRFSGADVLPSGADVTERKRAEEALRESEERLSEVLETSRDWVYKHNLETGRYDYIGPAVLQITGFTPEEFTAMGFEGAQRRVHPEDLQRHMAHLVSLLGQTGETGMVPTIRYRWKCKDGEYRWFSDNRAVIRDKDGRPVARVGTIRDITESMQAEEALRNSEEKYRRLIESLREGIWIIDKDAYTTFVNASMADMLGYTVDEMQGKHLFSFMDERGVEIAKRNLERRKQGIEEQHDFEFVRKDGTRVYATLETSPLTDDDGNYIGAIAGVIDITKRKRAEDALRESEERFRRLSEASLEGIVIHEEGIILEANRAFAAMFGYEASELTGMDTRDLAAPESRDLLSQNIFSRYAEPFEATATRKDGRTFPVVIHGRAMPYRGRMVGVTTVRDITERKQAEDALQKAKDELESKVEHQMQRGNPYGLTFRELTVLHLVAAGRADKEIGTELGISAQTAQKHVANILSKMDAASRTEASVRAVREGLLD